MNKGNKKGKQSKRCRILAKERLHTEQNRSLCRLNSSSGAVEEAVNLQVDTVNAVDAMDVSVRSGDVYKLRLAWDGDAYAGCFFELLSREGYLRRPISLCGKGEGYIELAIRVAGVGTQELVSRAVGDFVECFGPMGRGFDLPVKKTVGEDGEKRYLVVGGGIGVAPLQPLLEGLHVLGVGVDAVLGYKGKPYLDTMADYVCVEDTAVDISEYPNSRHSNVMPVLEELLDRYDYEDIYVCGPKKMLDAVALACLKRGHNPQLLTEAHFGCGVGACLVCTCEVNYEQKFARVCADGPMFRAKELFIDGAENIVLGKTMKKSSSSAFVENIAALSTGSKDSFVNDSSHREESVATNPLAVNLGGLALKSLLTTASGTFGFGREYNEFFDIGILGGVSVKGLTLREKAGNPGQRVVEVRSGMINSVGLQNPGVDEFIRTEVNFLREKQVAVIANINGGSVREMVAMAEKVNAVADAVELNISCPNVSAGGMSFGTDPSMVSEVVRAVRGKVDVPLIVKLTPNVTDITEIARVCEAEGADVLSLINTVTGLGIDPVTGKTPLSRGFGEMSGATVKPIALRCVHAVAGAVQLPILGMGGIGSASDVLEFLRCGATAIAIGTELFRNPLLPVEIDRELRSFLKEHKIQSISEIRRVDFI